MAGQLSLSQAEVDRLRDVFEGGPVRSVDFGTDAGFCELGVRAQPGGGYVVVSEKRTPPEGP